MLKFFCRVAPDTDTLTVTMVTNGNLEFRVRENTDANKADTRVELDDEQVRVLIEQLCAWLPTDVIATPKKFEGSIL